MVEAVYGDVHEWVCSQITCAPVNPSLPLVILVIYEQVTFLLFLNFLIYSTVYWKKKKKTCKLEFDRELDTNFFKKNELSMYILI